MVNVSLYLFLKKNRIYVILSRQKQKEEKQLNNAVFLTGKLLQNKKLSTCKVKYIFSLLCLERLDGSVKFYGIGIVALLGNLGISCTIYHK